MADERTFGPIEESDLEEIQQCACIELERFLDRAGRPPGKYNHYRDRLLCVCLVQGAAQHFVDMHADFSIDHDVEVNSAEIHEKGYLVTEEGRVISGIKDIDVFFFFMHDPITPIPDIKHSRKSEIVKLGRLGMRRLDFMKKGVRQDVLIGTSDIEGFIRNYLEKTNHGRKYLINKSIIGLHPANVFGQPLWATRRLARPSLRFPEN